MSTIIFIAQLVSAVILTVLILLQNKEGGLGGVFGGGDFGGAFRTKRGLEKSIFTATIIFSILFLGLSLLNILVKV